MSGRKWWKRRIKNETLARLHPPENPETHHSLELAAHAYERHHVVDVTSSQGNTQELRSK